MMVLAAFVAGAVEHGTIGKMNAAITPSSARRLG